MGPFLYNTYWVVIFMRKVVDFDDVSYIKYGKFILNHLNFDINKGEFVSIVGGNGSGKSILMDILAGFREYNGNIFINGTYLDRDNIFKIRSMIGLVMDDDMNIGGLVRDELYFTLENLGYTQEKTSLMVRELALKFEIDDILDISMERLSQSKRVVVMIVRALLNNPSILFIDSCFSYLNDDDRALVIRVMEEYKKKRKMTVVLFSRNIRDILFVDKVMVLYKGEIVMRGTLRNILRQEDKISRYGLDIPFCVKLSLALMDRGVINHIYLDEGKLVDVLWK